MKMAVRGLSGGCRPAPKSDRAREQVGRSRTLCPAHSGGCPWPPLTEPCRSHNEPGVATRALSP
jgi:hypothetical protein